MTHEFAKPDIAIPRSDHTRILRLAETLGRRNPDLAEQLFQELERAEIFPDETPRPVARIGVPLDYETGNGDSRTVTLVFPQDEDISAGRISVLTPVGVALLGLSAGQEMEWSTRDGRKQRLKVTRIDSQSVPVAASAIEAVPAESQAEAS